MTMEDHIKQNLSQGDWDFVNNSFQEFTKPEKEFSKNKKKLGPPCKIRINGQFIKVCSGKTIWRCKAHAKLALNHHLDNWFSINCFDQWDKIRLNGKTIQDRVHSQPGYSYYEYQQEFKRIVTDHIMGMVEFVEIYT